MKTPNGLGRNANESMMKLVDIEAIAKITKANKVLLHIDNTLQHRTCRIHWI
jgi:cystathionine beta-lyase/cystathionine gamma-synthase